MKIKRFLEKDSRTAMARVRAEMGPDAVILSNKSVGGQIELTAAMDFDETALQDAAVDVPVTSSQVFSEFPGAGNDTGNPTLNDLQRELGNLRNMLEGELSQLAWREMAGRPSVKAALYNRLVKLGLSRALCGAIVDQLPAKGDLEQIWKKALSLLARKMPVMAGDSLLNEGGIVALVGSTGVGKTTTIAKLAARFVMRHGNKQVALITTDRYRIGGQEQLETFAEYLNIPMVVATDTEQLRSALDKFSSRKLVLIDTAGMSQRDIRLHEQFQTLNSVGYDIDSYVVLSATAQPGALQEVVKAFGKDALAGAMITKVDESVDLGGILDVVVKNSLKLGYISIGQRVPEDLLPARVEYLIAKAIELAEINTLPVGQKSQNSATANHSIAV